jgi:Tfp pilus assembly protein PilO
MNNAPPKSGRLFFLVEQLRHPLKLRSVLCLVILGGWYFAFYSPLSQELEVTRTLINKERKRIAAAHQIDQLRDGLAVYKDRVPAKSGLNELIQYVMGQVRTSPLKLIDLKPDKAKDLGPYDAIALRITLEGTYTELDDFLAWIQNDRRLLRVDALGIAPAATRVSVNQAKDKDKGKAIPKLSIQLTLTSLVAKYTSEKPSG